MFDIKLLTKSAKAPSKTDNHCWLLFADEFICQSLRDIKQKELLFEFDL